MNNGLLPQNAFTANFYPLAMPVHVLVMSLGLVMRLRQLQDDQTVMIRMLQAREAELDLMRSLEQHYAGLRARLAEFERRLEKLEAVQ